MKDTEFIELLNLYLDHEISPADAARLESEVSTNPARRRHYEDYCRMQKACKLLAHDFATDAAPAAKVVAFETAARNRSSRSAYYIAGGLAAAAACVAVIFLSGERAALPATPEAPGVAITAPVTSAERTIGRTVSVPASEERTLLVDALTLGGASNGGAKASPLLIGSDAGAPQFEWIRKIELAPLQRVSIEQFQFTSGSVARPTNASPSQAPLRQPSEISAFEYTR